MIKPFLMKHASPCISPGRTTPSTQFFYDTTADMLRWLGEPSHPLAIHATSADGPMTKKGDIEKGEDAKDRRMWL